MKTTVLACAALAAGCAAAPGPDNPLEPAISLAGAERAFAAHSVRENARAAFLANFAEDGVLVRGTWVAALPALRAQAAAPIVLDWHPVYVEAARSGELGLSTGPWTITPRDALTPPLHGQFVSVWRRQDRRWKVVADIGVVHPEATLSRAPLETRVGSAAVPGGADDLAQAERAFASAASAGGVRAALRAYAARDLRFYRAGEAPRLDLAAAMQAAAMTADPVAYSVQASEVAKSGEMGYARGAYATADEKEHGAWLRVWRREGAAWRVAVDVTNAAR